MRHCFRFPTGAVLPDGGQVVVYTGYGTNDGVSFYMNSGQAVWNNDRATTLYDEAGTPGLTYVY